MSINPSDGLSPEELQKLQEIYRKTLPERLRAIEEAIHAVEKKRLSRISKRTSLFSS